MLFLTYARPRVQQIIAALATENIQASSLSFQQIVQTQVQAADCQDHAQRIDQFDYIVFISPNSIDAFFQVNQDLIGPGSVWFLEPERLVVVGPGSQAALDHWLGTTLPACEAPAPKLVRTQDADGVLDQLISKAAVRSAHGTGLATKVLVVKGTAGRVDWIQQARHAGLIIQELQAYCAQDCWPDDAATDALIHCKHQNLSPLLLLTSTSNVARLILWAQSKSQAKLLPWLQQQTVLAIHPRIAAQLRAQSFADVKEISPGFDALRTAALN